MEPRPAGIDLHVNVALSGWVVYVMNSITLVNETAMPSLVRDTWLYTNGQLGAHCSECEGNRDSANEVRPLIGHWL